MATAALEYHHVHDNFKLVNKNPYDLVHLHHQHEPTISKQLAGPEIIPAVDPKTLIGEALHRRVESIDHELCEPGDEDTFFVADLGDVYRQHLRWKKALPRIKPFYGKQSLFSLSPTT